MERTGSAGEPRASPARGHNPIVMPTGLPIPEDDGAAAHLPGARMPRLRLPATDGSLFPVGRPPVGFDRLVLYAYPRTGRPGEDPLTADWDQIPGARGCTPESCGFRDHAAELARLGAAVVGLSTQPTDYQREAVERLRLPFPLLSDAKLRLAGVLQLPTFQAGGQALLKRLTLVVRDGHVEKVFYPVFPPDGHAEEVLGWIQTGDGGGDWPSGRPRSC
jgi:peroxiredoxin